MTESVAVKLHELCDDLLLTDDNEDRAKIASEGAVAIEFLEAEKAELVETVKHKDEMIDMLSDAAKVPGRMFKLIRDLETEVAMLKHSTEKETDNG